MATNQDKARTNWDGAVDDSGAIIKPKALENSVCDKLKAAWPTRQYKQQLDTSSAKQGQEVDYGHRNNHGAARHKTLIWDDLRAEQGGRVMA